jgi:hypothetical protein
MPDRNHCQSVVCKGFARRRTAKVRREGDVGVLQINLEAHASELAALGLDVVQHTEAGNLAYRKILYAQEGLRPPSGSKLCWSGSELG